MISNNQKPLTGYQILNNWLRDGNLKSQYPKELEDDKSISQVFFLNYFESSPKYFPFINKLFNNFNLFSVPVKSLCITLKEMLYFTGFKQLFISRAKKTESNKLCDILRKKYPYYKKEEISMIVDIIDNSEDKDSVYEMFGIYSIKVKKLNAKEKKLQREKIDSMISKNDILDDL